MTMRNTESAVQNRMLSTTQHQGLESVLTGSAGECVENVAADEAADNTDNSGDGNGAC